MTVCARCGIIALSLALPAASLIAQAVDTVWVTVHGQRMHLLIAGSGSAVVLEAGAGSTHRMWTTLQRELARTHRVVSYDRAGMGKSPVSTRPRTARVIAEELRRALQAAGIAPPFLLVGHSLGGAYVRVFAGLYPAEVTGIVLVDPVAEDFYARAQREQPRVYAYFDSLDLADVNAAPPGERAEADATDSTLAQMRQLDTAFAGPAIVLSSPRYDLKELGPIWTDEHRKWAARRPQREYVLVDSVGHAIHRERPTVVLDAVQRVARRLR